MVFLYDRQMGKEDIHVGCLVGSYRCLVFAFGRGLLGLARGLLGSLALQGGLAFFAPVHAHTTLQSECVQTHGFSDDGGEEEDLDEGHDLQS